MPPPPRPSEAQDLHLRKAQYDTLLSEKTSSEVLQLHWGPKFRLADLLQDLLLLQVSPTGLVRFLGDLDPEWEGDRALSEAITTANQVKTREDGARGALKPDKILYRDIVLSHLFSV